MDKFDTCVKQTEVLTRVTRVNSWDPAVCMSYMNHNFLSVKLSTVAAHVTRVTET